MRIRGIIPALHTAYDDRGELDPARQAHLVERLIDQGAHGLFCGGSTGEFPLLSVEERESLLDTVLEAARGRVPVIVHVGAFDRRDALRLARHAAARRAGAVSCLPPLYYRLRPPEVLDHLRAVAEAAAPLDFYAYHIPELTGVPMSLELLRGLLTIPCFAGLKWSDPDLAGLHRAVQVLGDRSVLAGIDELLLPALTLGARGAIGSSYNFLAPWFVGLWEAFAAGDLRGASHYQALAARVHAVVLEPDGALTKGKAATRWAGLDCGEPRPPLRRISSAERAVFEAALVTAGLPRGGLGKTTSSLGPAT